MKYITLILLLCALPLLINAQNTGNVKEQETLSLLESTSLNDAVQILEALSWKTDQKKIINTSDFDKSIGVPIHNLTWKKALELIALQNGLVVEEHIGVVYIKNRYADKSVAEQAKKELFDIFTKQVRISATAFTCDKAYLKSLGIDWSTLLNGKVQANIDFTTSNNVPGNILSLTGSRAMSSGGQTIEINTLLKVVESDELGTVIARPQVTVSSGKQGFIQVGQDVSVKSVDDAGNTTDRFFATGVIMDVQPTVIQADTTNVIHLIASVERSSATPGDVSTVINKSKSVTDVVMYDGEETVIGGLYSTDEIKTRGGIPILRDLPWWVLGIRYLTGFYKTEKKERELVIIIKAEIMDDAVLRRLNSGK